MIPLSVWAKQNMDTSQPKESTQSVAGHPGPDQSHQELEEGVDLGNVTLGEESDFDSGGDAAVQLAATDSERLGLEGDDATRDPVTLFITPDELFSPSDWGDVLRLINFRRDDLRLVPNSNQPDRCWDLMLYNRATGMWRVQGNADFLPLWDSLLAGANDEAVRCVEETEIITDRAYKRLVRHVASSSRSSVVRAAKRAIRIADDPLVTVDRIETSSLNQVESFPVFPCNNGMINLADGTTMEPEDLRGHYLLDMAPANVDYRSEFANSNAPEADAMRRFLKYLGCGDGSIIARRLGWQLCGRHQTIDVIAGDLAALELLAQVLHATLGPSGVRLLTMAQGTVKAQNLADGMERSRLCLWSGADTNKGIPVWEIAALVNRADPRRPAICCCSCPTGLKDGNRSTTVSPADVDGHGGCKAN